MLEILVHQHRDTFLLLERPEQSRNYSQLASKFNVKIVTDETSIPSSQTLITRPLDRLKVSEGQPFTLYEIIDQKNQDNDEWLYELENSKKNNKFQDYSHVFDLFTTSFWSGKEGLSSSDAIQLVTEGLQVMNHFSEKEFQNNDISCSRVVSCLQYLIDNKKTFNNTQSIISFLTSYSNTLSYELIKE